MRPSVESQFEGQTKSVFDRSVIGEHVSAERFDQPGDESPLFRGSGASDNLAAGPQPRPGADLGDWSWKPFGHPGARVRQPIGGCRKMSPMTTFTGVPPGAAELYGRKAYRPQA